MGESVSPSDRVAKPDAKVAKSEVKVANRQPIDYFAEQNQNRAEKKRKTAKKRRIAIIVGVILALIAIAVTVTLIVIDAQRPKPTVSDDNDGSGNADLAGVQNLNEEIEEAFAPTYSVNENGDVVVEGDLEAVEAMFKAALANPANKNRIDTIHLARIVFYTSIMDNQRVVEIADEVNPENLNNSEKVKFYNLTYLAYTALGNSEQAGRYKRLTTEAASKVKGIGG